PKTSTASISEVVEVHHYHVHPLFFFFFQAEDGIRDPLVTGVQTCALPIYALRGDCRTERDARGQAIRCRHGGGVRRAVVVNRERSEERRVGKECRCGWGPEHEKKKG